MRRMTFPAVLILLLLGAPAFADEVIHEAGWSTADLDQVLPADLVDPVGKTRWELEELVSSGTWSRAIHILDDGSLSILDTRDAVSGPLRYSASARDWWMPHEKPLQGATQILFAETKGRVTEEFSVRTQRLGSGWAFLPSGPRETILERAYVMRSTGGKGALQPHEVIYRWIDPRAGVVAEAWGRPGPGGEMLELRGAATVESVTRGGAPLKIYSFEIETTPFNRLALGFDRNGTCTTSAVTCVEDADCTGGGTDRCTVPVAAVTATSHIDMTALLAAPSWDFTPTQLANSRYEVGTTTAPINSSETCNFGQCGFATTAIMGREDKNFSVAGDEFITLSATEGEQRAGDYTIWLRAGVRWEGRSGGLGEGESRFCYEGIDTNGDTRPDVPLWRFSTQDPAGWYMQDGDTWSHTPFNCEQSVFNHVCPAGCGLFCPIWIKGCSGQPNQGTQSSEVVAEGPVTTPSGHTMNALVVRQTVDFCVYLGNGCGLQVDSVHQVIHLWVVPNFGTIARLMSEQNATGTISQLQETDLKYGLFSPRSIASTGETDTTISISWDPGTVTHHITGYKVYWDTDSGSSSTYAFNSDTHPGQVSILGTTATISGLTAGTDYYVTVTALSDFANPSTNVTMTYESLLFPTLTSGSPGPLPPELMTTTTGGVCTPTKEVDSVAFIQMSGTGLTVNKFGATNIEMCWHDPGDVCVDGYTILGANSPEAAVNFSPVVPDTGLVTCHVFNPAETYFLVIGKGTGGGGPWGHYGM